MSAANPTPAQYSWLIKNELRQLKMGRQSEYTERRIKTLEQRLEHMFVPEEEVLWNDRKYSVIDRGLKDDVWWVLLSPGDPDLRTSWVPEKETRPI